MRELYAGLATLLGGAIATSFFLLWKYPWLRYDFHYIKVALGILRIVSYTEKNKKFLIDMFEENVKKTPKKTFIIFRGKEYSYEYMNKQMNKVANMGLGMGLKCGDAVAVLMYNEPAFIWTFYGFQKIGVQCAFINFNLRSKSLQHCINVSSAKHLIVGDSDTLVDAVTEVYPNLTDIEVRLWGNQLNQYEQFSSIAQKFSEASDSTIDATHRKEVNGKTPGCFIYTSGTTGLPKAAVVTQIKVTKGASLMNFAGATSTDVIYTALPLYHSAAGLIALGNTALNGSTLVLREKFSASKFLEDCRQHKVTVIQHIGEVCRYIYSRPPSTSDKDHCIRIAFGNGLRRDIWEDFQQRFNIPRIYEFYAATEGSIGFINVKNKVGAVGRASPFLQFIMPTIFVKYNFATAEPERDSRGFCILSDKDEPGLMISPIKQGLEFDGFKGPEEQTKKRILTNVFKKGDIYMNSGDLFIRDKDYFVYFSDRIGDTFRWKGENVATIEVSNVVANAGEWIQDANVYGVEVPGQEGRAGMVSLTLTGENKEPTPEQLKSLMDYCIAGLPIYAIPRFIRCQSEMAVTSTFKQQKFDLVKDGFNPDLCKGDPLYVADVNTKTYIPITKQVQTNILNGNMKL